LIATPPTTAKSTSRMTSSQSSGTIPSFSVRHSLPASTTF
jgi:hypothetical protein